MCARASVCVCVCVCVYVRARVHYECACVHTWVMGMEGEDLERSRNLKAPLLKTANFTCTACTPGKGVPQSPTNHRGTSNKYKIE